MSGLAQGDNVATLRLLLTQVNLFTSLKHPEQRCCDSREKA
jgi:hypothetical protein